MQHSLIVPEVVRGAAFESGAAVLEAALKGLSADFQRAQIQALLPNDAQTRTTMESLTEAAETVGLVVAHQTLPLDHLLTQPDSLPAIVVTAQPDDQDRFVLVWRRHGPFLQLMDPLLGRRWVRIDTLLNEIVQETTVMAAARWRQEAATEPFLTSLRQRMETLQIPAAEVERLQAQALADPGWRSLALLDAATRAVDAAVRRRLLRNSGQAQQMLEQLLSQTQAADVRATHGHHTSIPDAYWSVSAVEQHLPEVQDQAEVQDERPDGTERLQARTIRVLRIAGWAKPAEDASPQVAEDAAAYAEAHPRMAAQSSEDQVEALEAQTKRTQQRLWQALRADGLLVPAVLAAAALTSGAGLIFEALLLQSLIQMGQLLSMQDQRIAALMIVLLFFILFLFTGAYAINMGLQMGLRLEARLRIAFLERIPYLSSQYFSSRPIADLVQRAFSIRSLQGLPDRGIELLQRLFRFLFTAVGIIWLEPTNLWIILLAITIYAGSMLLVAPVLNKRGLRSGVASNNLRRYPLDALLGLIPLRAHGAERALQRAHEGNLVLWSRAFLAQTGTGALAQTYLAFVFALITALILYNYIAQGGKIQNILLLTYWAMSLPDMIKDVTASAMVYISLIGTSSMLYEPLTAPTEFPELDGQNDPDAAMAEEDLVAALFPTEAVTITLEQITLRLGGKTVLKNVDVTIDAGEHVGMVGPSGAGKSTLVGLLLGWHVPDEGRILINGRALDGRAIKALRQRTAWVDPAIQIWNRSFMDNLVYGSELLDAPPLGPVIDQADLLGVLEHLPEGVQTPLGESGGLISGGEGQRVRFGRAMMRKDVQLVILDEPFRGLDRAKRGQLLQRAREYWQGATLICVTHDVDEIQTFERVLVVEGGQIVENATPDELRSRENSRYKDLLAAEQAVRSGLWAATDWRRLWMEAGKLKELI